MGVMHIKGGPQLGKLVDSLMTWQLSHPAATQEDCMAWLKENGPALLESK